MKKHSGMRPQDVVILLKIIAKGDAKWYMKDLANELQISNSEVSESLNRSVFAELLAPNKTMVMRSALYEFLVFGIRYVYPEQLGPLSRGTPTAWSAEPLCSQIVANEHVVWPTADGTMRGQSIAPLHPSVPQACARDPRLHELLSLVDALRIGRAREQKMAIDELKQRML